MPRRPSPALTDAELRIMRVLWDRDRATVGEVVDTLGGHGEADRPAYNTVLTILKILEKKGYVSHHKDGRAFVYRPVVDGSQARRRALSHLLTRFFDGSRELLVQDLLGHDRPAEEQLARIRELLAVAPGEHAHESGGADTERDAETRSTKRGRS